MGDGASDDIYLWLKCVYATSLFREVGGFESHCITNMTALQCVKPHARGKG